jgi:lipoic acid synthetase
MAVDRDEQGIHKARYGGREGGGLQISDMNGMGKPSWIRAKAPLGEKYDKLRAFLESLNVNTICIEAVCPNIGDCWGRKVMTFMILGDRCTRGCRFCAVKRGKPLPPSSDEPRAIAEAVKALGLRYVVLTSVTRDDLPDGGASQFKKTVEAIREEVRGCKVEVLVPDFMGKRESIKEVLEASPEVFGHNIETVRRLYPMVRVGADYERSLEVLRLAKEISPDIVTKSGIMVGLGEGLDEIEETMRDLRDVGCDLLTIGQYLSPSPRNLPVVRYYTPDDFLLLKEMGERMGFLRVSSGPLVRSSYMADSMIS